MGTRILSLDIATTTGWATYTNKKKFIGGLIKTLPKWGEAKRLSYFRAELLKLFKKYKPTHVVMEDIYAGKNIKTLKLLAKFAGVTQECCITEIDIEPYIIHTSTVKAYFKAKGKEDLFGFVSGLIDWEDANFKKDNDMVDAIAQLMCYWDKVLKERQFRIEKEYGYLYEVN